MKPKSRKHVGRAAASEEFSELRLLLAEAQATLKAIRKGEVDAVVVEGKRGPRVFTLDGAEFDYRILIESMNEGALVVTRNGLILYANGCFARMAGRPLVQLMGGSIHDLLSDAGEITVKQLLKRPGSFGGATEVLLQRPLDVPVHARLSIQRLPSRDRKSTRIGMVVSDLTELHDREELLRSLSHGLMQLQETERKQIATELGENISQLLCCTLMRCQGLAAKLPALGNGVREEALEFADLLRTTASEVDRISTNLKPHGLEALGLVAALRGVVAEFAERMGLPVKLSFAKLSARLPEEIEVALYRVLQEALRNVEQHAHAQRVRVSIGLRDSIVRLAIKDDGIGFDARDQSVVRTRAGRFGLLSMRERAKAVGGSLIVKSTPTRGTEVRLEAPIPSADSLGVRVG